MCLLGPALDEARVVLALLQVDHPCTIAHPKAALVLFVPVQAKGVFFFFELTVVSSVFSFKKISCIIK